MEEKYIQQFKKGAYEMVLLSLIAQKETYGYEILTEIQKQGGEILSLHLPKREPFIRSCTV